MMRMMTVATVIALSATLGCKDDPNPCDSTTYYDGASCYPKTDAALVNSPDAFPTGAEANPALDGGGLDTTPQVSLLGAPCSDTVTHAECQGPDTDYCAVQPGSPGYCTKAGCATDADCPASWTCFDLAKLGITGYPPMCTKPRA